MKISYDSLEQMEWIKGQESEEYPFSWNVKSCQDGTVTISNFSKAVIALNNNENEIPLSIRLKIVTTEQWRLINELYK